MLSFTINLTETITMSPQNSISLENLNNLKQIPESPGVYVLHHGNLIDAWDSGHVFYIGATYAEGLRKRATKHRSVLLAEKSKKGGDKVPGSQAMKTYGVTIRNQINDIFISFYDCPGTVEQYLPFVFESVLLLEYERKNERMPAVNKAKR